MNPRRVLVTGAAGYIGRALVAQLVRSDHDVVALVRDADAVILPVDGARYVTTGDLAAPQIDLTSVFAGADALYHLISPRPDQGEEMQRRVHIDATNVLIEAAAEAKVGWFCYLSSIKAAAGESHPTVVGNHDEPAPTSVYGRYKRAAEELVLQAATRMDVSVVRCPMVYGPDAPGNFARLQSWVASGVPVPRFAAEHARSIVYLDNLVHGLIHLLEHHAAADSVVHVADAEPVSTNQLFELIASAAGVSPTRLPVPSAVTRVAGWLPVLSGYAERLAGPLAMDISNMRAIGWEPPITTREGVARSAPRLE